MRRNVRLRTPGRLGATAVIGLGLLLVLAATVGPLPSPTGEPGASLAVRLPDAARTLVFALLALSAIILLALQRPRRPIDDGPALPTRARRRLPLWAAALLPLPLLLAVAAVWYLIWHYWSGGDGHPIEQAFTAIAELLELLALSRKPTTSVPFFDLTITVLVVLFAVGLFTVMVLIALADRLERWWARPAVAGDRPARPRPVGAGLDDPRAEPDPRAAIIRAWARFEQALAAARAPRAPWQTPAEFMRTALARLPVPVPPVRRLTALFEIARFSDRSLDLGARDAACDCLDEITTALDALPPPIEPALRSDPEDARGEA
jgi:hypothetical protein